MTKKKHICYLQKSILCLGVLGLWAGFAHAKMKPAEPGTIRMYQSDNKRYEVEVAFGDHGMNLWRMKEDGRILWDNALVDDYANITIADNGEMIAVTTWGWQEAGQINGVTFYNKKGQLVKTVAFPQASLKWIGATAVSPDGKYFILGESMKDQARIILYNIDTGKVIWEKKAGREDVVEIKISPGTRRILVATRQDNGSDMMFLLFDKKGKILWHKELNGLYSLDVKRYLKFKDEEGAFEIFDPKEEVFILQKYP